MKIRKEFIVLVVVVAVLSGYLVWQRQKPTAYLLPDLPKVDRSDITRIRIERPDTAPVELKKIDAIWRVGEELFKADADKVNGMLEIIETLELTALASETGQYARYHLDEAQRIRVQAWAGDRLQRDFAIGKTAPTYRHTFVTVAGDEKVYHARKDFRGRFDRDLDQLRDKRVMAFDRETIQAVSLTVGKAKPVTFTRVADQQPGEKAEERGDPKPEGSNWQGAEGAPVGGQTLDNLVSSLASLECERYLYDRTKADLEAGEPDYIIELTGEREQPYRLLLFAPLEGGGEDRPRPGVSSESDDPFVVSAFHAREFSEQIAKLTGAKKSAK
ncbi:MAG: DUF4340 domain-containing protein [Deltaproteobacteria bacterium]|nr:DUF4340 domain-containing protein [Deltaproteobacteria bacterium]